MAGAGGQRLSWSPQDHQVPAMGLSGIQSRRWASQELLPRRTMSWNLPETSIRTNPRPVNAPSWSSKRLRRQTSFNRYYSPLRDCGDPQDPWQPTVCSWVSDEAHPRANSVQSPGYKAKEGSRLHWDFNHQWDALRSSPLVLNVTDTKLPVKSILKGQTTTRKKIAKVYFPTEESEVIGEGGEDAGTISDQDDDDDVGNACPEDEAVDKDEDEAIQALQELTRFNTDFNSIAANLMKDATPSTSTTTPPSRNFTPLKLGKPLTDSDGKRQTLLVSVQPFGDKSTPVKVTTNDVTTPKSSSNSNGVSLDGLPETPPPPPPVQATPTASPKQMFLKSIVEPDETATIVIKPLCPSSPPTSPTSPTETSDVSQTKNNTLPGRPEKRTQITRATPITKNNEVLLKTKLILTSKNDELVKAKALGRDSKNGSSTDLKMMPTILPRLKAENDVVIVSRASVGEPDGRADPDESGEHPPPVLSSSPKEDTSPTHEAMTIADPRPSFLHGLSKPKLPVKPQGVPQSVPQRWAIPVLTTPVGIAAAAAAAASAAAANDVPHTPSNSPPPSPPPSPPMTSPDGGETSGRSLKRQAPKPPPSADDSMTASVTDEFDQEENDVGNDEIECPSSERVNGPECAGSPPSCSPLRSRELPNGLSSTSRSESVPALVHVQMQAPQLPTYASTPMPTPLPQPRKALSKSHDSLASPPFGKYFSSSGAYEAERKTKNGTKGRFSLRKLLGLARDSVRDDSISPGGLADLSSSLTGSPSELSLQPPQLRPRPRLEIIHPSDLNGTAVEVVRGTGPEVRRQIREATEALQAAQAAYRRGSDVSSDSSGSQPPTVGSPPHAAGRPMKPPPPPRSASTASTENDRAHEATTAGIGRPSRPPPPKSAELLRRQRQPPSPPVAPSLPSPTTTNSSDSTDASVYANLDFVSGEVRSGMAPHKPQRTGSVRDATADGPKRTPLAAMLADTTNDVIKTSAPTQQTQDAALAKRSSRQSKDSVRASLTRMSNLPSAVQPEDSGYESVELASEQAQSGADSENVYECVNGSSSPECDLTNVEASAVTERTTVHNPSDFQRFSTFLRPSSVSMPYCGSETESDIYSPYSFYGSEEGGEDDTDAASAAWKYGRRQLRKGRSIVHKSMEDNYGAVVGANHEALAQLLEQMKAGPPVPPPLRPLKTLSSLSWSDFTVNARTCVSVGRWAFVSAHWGSQPVTLGVAPDQGPPTALNSRLGAFALDTITEFSDLVPVSLLPSAKANNKEHVPAWIAVLSRVRVDTLSSYGQFLSRLGQDVGDGSPSTENETVSNGAITDGALADGKTSAAREEALREASVVLLQLVNALKGLQAQGEEEVNPDCVVLLRDPATDHFPQLALVHTLRHSEQEQNGMSVCQCALYAVHCLLPAGPLTTLISSLLSKERAESLSRAKAVLEYWLWGPGDAALGLMVREREAALQRWLDLERATVLHRLVCARTAGGATHRLAPPEQNQLMFLVRTSAKTMCEASQLLDSQSIKPLDNSTF